MIGGARSVVSTMPPVGTIEESVFIIGASASGLVAVLACPADATKTKPVGLVIVVGGPQTRVGSHRQFVLMARALAQSGYPCLRFDYTGMGDSPGSRPDFERAGPDIGRACDALVARVPGCAKIVLWGLCDGATAALFYAPSDERIAAVVAANPWARSDATRSAALVSGHYGPRLRSGKFWKRLLAGNVDVLAAAREAFWHLMRAGARREMRNDPDSGDTLSERLARALAAGGSKVRLQISGRDLTAAEFEIAVTKSGLPQLGVASVLRILDADHTFSDSQHWERVIADAEAVLARL